MTIIKIDSQNLNTTVEDAVHALEEGKVIVCPTDTVYGLLADATNEKAVERVFELKRRERTKPFSVFVKDVEVARELAHVGQDQEMFLEEAWPGRVTAVLQSRQVLPKVFEQEGKIGLRVPDYPLLNEILNVFNKPLTGTSANISGMASCTDSADVKRQFQAKQPDVMIDAGVLPLAKPSQVVDISEKEKKILRE